MHEKKDKLIIFKKSPSASCIYNCFDYNRQIRKISVQKISFYSIIIQGRPKDTLAGAMGKLFHKDAWKRYVMKVNKIIVHKHYKSK